MHLCTRDYFGKSMYVCICIFCEGILSVGNGLGNKVYRNQPKVFNNQNFPLNNNLPNKYILY